MNRELSRDFYDHILDSSDVSGQVNIASGCPVAVKTIILKIAEQLNQRELLQLGALPLSTSEPPLLVADVTRLSKEVNWQPKYDLSQGLDITIDWWKTHSDFS
jgi:nucleoside-diphosphate-sugar epimerase